MPGLIREFHHKFVGYSLGVLHASLAGTNQVEMNLCVVGCLRVERLLKRRSWGFCVVCKDFRTNSELGQTRNKGEISSKCLEYPGIEFSYPKNLRAIYSKVQLWVRRSFCILFMCNPNLSQFDMHFRCAVFKDIFLCLSNSLRISCYPFAYLQGIG